MSEDGIGETLGGTRRVDGSERTLVTVLFADIVGSTQQAAALGDHRWRNLLEDYHKAVRREVDRHGGHEIDTAGDGVLATFATPLQSIRCGCAIRDAVRCLGIEIRIGLHTGECERIGEKLGGIAVHIGARVASHASADEILVSGTVRDLVAGSGVRFKDRGTHVLKGIPGRRRLFAVDKVEETPAES